MPLTEDERELLIACRLGKAETVRAVLERGVSPNVADVQGRSAILKAAIGGHREIIRILMDAGADTAEVAQTNIVREMVAPGSTAPSKAPIPEDVNYYEVIQANDFMIPCDGFDNLLFGPDYSGLVIFVHALETVGSVQCAAAVRRVIALVEQGGLVDNGFSADRVQSHLGANRGELRHIESDYCQASCKERPVEMAAAFMRRGCED